ncbi:hypothetical protein [Mycolicibacterium iranicum]|uniref:Uncharacterized protein n=1 Tax=Mycolicibacterium iranicum TaxID=912594 RepID=A0A178LS26_MYCIR|nr:hypothetical protein [Mycolicibacterium iranicum]OAN36780.1 hypothetical protein A4X20_06180 [Mycolicibacterium iranicum]
MTFALRGALVEYGSDFLGPLPNVVVFAINPESMTRTIQIPARPTGTAARETTQAGEVPVEKFTVKVELDASQNLDAPVDVSLARAFGVGPALAALEKMARPASAGLLGAAIGAAVDAIGSALGLGGGDDAPTQPIPREKYPRILFIWGPTRVLPVVIESMSISELQYDYLLNPVRAEVTIGFAVNQPSKCSDDIIAQGATTYTDTVKEAQALINLVNSVALVIDMIPF